MLERLHLKTDNHDREFLELTGEVTLPTEPFRIAVSGRDAKGMPYQRFDSPLFHAETVQVVPKFNLDEIAPGVERTGEFEVKNFGPARTFKVTVTDARKLVSSFEPKELAVPAHGSGIVKVQLAVPAGTSTFRHDLIAVVASTSGTPTTNSAIVHLSVATKPDAEGQR